MEVFEEGWTEDLPKLNYKEVRELTFDFGMHVTGYFSFSTRIIRRCQDAPVRFRLTFGELPAEINTPLEPWKGTLSRAWMQDEIITLDMIGNAYTLPRRMAFRYVKVELLGASSDFDFAISDVTCKAVSSAGRVQTTLLRTCPPDIANINKVSVATLGECMQTVYEDGPKRDRRLWAGDMYLESLANRYSYKNFNLTKHCLYIFAALTDSLGRVLSNCFEWPYYHAQPDSYCLNYSLLWTSTLLEYLKDTGDIATANDLWPVALSQIELALQSVGKIMSIIRLIGFFLIIRLTWIVRLRLMLLYCLVYVKHVNWQICYDVIKKFLFICPLLAGWNRLH